jgi:hypothetical protein
MRGGGDTSLATGAARVTDARVKIRESFMVRVGFGELMFCWLIYEAYCRVFIQVPN